MGSYRRHVGALLRRNLVYRKRAWFGTVSTIYTLSSLALFSFHAVRGTEVFETRIFGLY